MTQDILLKNGTVYDPINDINGEVMDICISDGKIVEKVSGSAKEIDLSRSAVMPGGVDMHSHIIGSKLNVARMTSPDANRHFPLYGSKKTRSGVAGIIPSSYATGYLYSRMGYTTVIEPALPAVKGLGAWEEAEDIPGLDMAMLPLFSNSMITFRYIQDDDISGLAAYIAWTLKSVGGFGVKVVNPGGTYAWAYGKNVRELDTEVPQWGITPREIVTGIANAVESLGLPHQLHLHPNNLGRVGNVKTTIEQLDALKNVKGHDKRKEIVHLTHMSFDCLGMTEDGDHEWKDVSSGGVEFAEYYDKNEHFTTDLGQITFGPAMTMTGDGPFQFSLYQMSGGTTKWSNIPVDVELPGGAGIVPFTFTPSSPANSVQWAIPLEFALSIDDVWRCVMTTDHPNGGPFQKYPLVISWLMSKKQRENWIDKTHKYVAERTALPDIDREYTLSEIAIVTRAGPAKILGMDVTKGHLGIGADADIAVFGFNPEKIELAKTPDKIVRHFSQTLFTFKGGQQVAKGGRIGVHLQPRVFSIRPQLREDLQKRIDKELEEMMGKWFSHSFSNYPVPKRYRVGIEQQSIIDATSVAA
ncbi:formylmethanofuran dehydrogenase subunit A [Candidatus Thorarchaeota archaeon]|nr:MAG: formylmethanofuran dehydrogenase subunit A [Candidatus Thorarchaeota archaeon]